MSRSSTRAPHRLSTSRRTSRAWRARLAQPALLARRRHGAGRPGALRRAQGADPGHLVTAPHTPPPFSSVLEDAGPERRRGRGGGARRRRGGRGVMTAEGIAKLTMPKWGLSMTEGTVLEWPGGRGREIASGQEDPRGRDRQALRRGRGAGGRHAAQAGRTGGGEGPRRRPARRGAGAAEVPDEDVDAFVADFVESFEPEEEADAGPQPETVEVDAHLRQGRGRPDRAPAASAATSTTGCSARRAREAGRWSRIDLPGHGGSSKEIVTPACRSHRRARRPRRARPRARAPRGALARRRGGGGVGGRAPRPRLASLTLIAGAGSGRRSATNTSTASSTCALAQAAAARAGAAVRRPRPPLSRQLVDDVLKFKRLDGVDAARPRSVAGAVFPDGRQAIDVRAALGSVDAPSSSCGASRTGSSIRRTPTGCRTASAWSAPRRRGTRRRWSSRARLTRDRPRAGGGTSLPGHADTRGRGPLRTPAAARPLHGDPRHIATRPTARGRRARFLCLPDAHLHSCRVSSRSKRPTFGPWAMIPMLRVFSSVNLRGMSEGESSGRQRKRALRARAYCQGGGPRRYVAGISMEWAGRVRACAGHARGR